MGIAAEYSLGFCGEGERPHEAYARAPARTMLAMRREGFIVVCSFSE